MTGFEAMMSALATDEDAVDAEIARRRLLEIAADPSALVSGEELERRFDEME